MVGKKKEKPRLKRTRDGRLILKHYCREHRGTNITALNSVYKIIIIIIKLIRRCQRVSGCCPNGFDGPLTGETRSGTGARVPAKRVCPLNYTVNCRVCARRIVSQPFMRPLVITSPSVFFVLFFFFFTIFFDNDFLPVGDTTIGNILHTMTIIKRVSILYGKKFFFFTRETCVCVWISILLVIAARRITRTRDYP